MATFINNNSALILLVMLVASIAWLGWDYRRRKRALVVLAAIAVVLIGGYLSAQAGPSDVATLAEVDAVLASGAPVVLEIYSDN